MALARTEVGAYNSGTPPHGTAAFVTGAFTPPDNSLLVVAVGCEENGQTGSTIGRPTISGGGWTYTQRGFTQYTDAAGFDIQNTIYTAPVTTGASMTLTVDDPGNVSIYSWSVQVLAYTGYDSGTPIAGEVDSGTANIGDGAESQTLTATPTIDDVLLYWLYADCDNQPMLPTMASGWTKVFDSGVTAAGAMATARRESSTSTTVDCTDVYTAVGSIFKGMMISLIVKATAAGAAPKPPVSLPLIYLRRNR